MEKQQSTFEKCLASARRQYKRSGKALEATETCTSNRDMDNAYAAAFDFAHETEKLTLLARMLPAYTGRPDAQYKIEQMILKDLPVEIGFTREGWFGLFIPSLLPKKSKGSPVYYQTLIYPAMRKFFRGKPPVCYPDCVLIFRHVYNENRPERAYRDHDNIELNMIVDILALYVLIDDMPLRCAHYYCSAAGHEDRTQVFVVPQDEFSNWLALSKNHGKEGVKLYENRL